MQMTTGQVAKVCHVTVRTVQYYDKKGIVSQVKHQKIIEDYIQKRI